MGPVFRGVDLRKAGRRAKVADSALGHLGAVGLLQRAVLCQLRVVVPVRAQRALRCIQRLQIRNIAAHSVGVAVAERSAVAAERVVAVLSVRPLRHRGGRRLEDIRGPGPAVLYAVHRGARGLVLFAEPQPDRNGDVGQ